MAVISAPHTFNEDDLYVDLRPTFAGHYAEYIEADGINPTSTGAAVAATAIWDTLAAKCLAQ